MMPTLLQGDFIFVKKFSYGLRLPVTETKILETGSPGRGDVVVFKYPVDPRRDFIKTSAAIGAASAAGPLLGGRALADFSPQRAEKPLKILIMGGTAFIGPAFVNMALARGHEITFFNRGRTTVGQPGAQTTDDVGDDVVFVFPVGNIRCHTFSRFPFGDI